MPVDKRKIGQFFMFIGLILLVIFFVAGPGRISAYGYLLGGLGLLLLGGIIQFRDRQPIDPNTARFRTVRKFRERKDKRKEEREQRRKM